MKHRDPNRETMNKYAGRVLKRIRNEMGLSQLDVAEWLSLQAERAIDHKTIYRWENGLATVPAWVIFEIELLQKQVNSQIGAEPIKNVAIEQRELLLNAILNTVRGWLKDNI